MELRRAARARRRRSRGARWRSSPGDAGAAARAEHARGDRGWLGILLRGRDRRGDDAAAARGRDREGRREGAGDARARRARARGGGRRSRALEPVLRRALEDAAGARRASTPVDTAADDVAIIAFTSGTTGHAEGLRALPPRPARDCDTFARARAATRSPTTSSPARRRSRSRSGSAASCCSRCASARRRRRARSPGRADARVRSRERGVTTLFTAPTGYRALLARATSPALAAHVRVRGRAAAGRRCRTRGSRRPASASSTGSARPRCCTSSSPRRPTRRAPGLVRAAGAGLRGADRRTTTCRRCRRARSAGSPCAAPTGCRYLDDPRQSAYVRDGWNLTGDAFSMDDDGYFWFQARTDDMIISSGYNISGFEVEAALLEHPAVAECAVVAAPDERARARGEGVRRRAPSRSMPRGRAAGPRQGADRAVQVPAPDRVRRRAAAHPDRQGPAQRAAGAGRQ